MRGQVPGRSVFAVGSLGCGFAGVGWRGMPGTGGSGITCVFYGLIFLHFRSVHH